MESGFPHALSPDLDRARVHDFDSALASPMTAHPKVDPDTGELVFFGYDLFGPPFLRYHVSDATGLLTTTREIDLPRAVMMHDFAVTATRVVFFDLPVVFDLDMAAAGRGWDRSASPRICCRICRIIRCVTMRGRRRGMGRFRRRLSGAR